jgi:hypothetical protein
MNANMILNFNRGIAILAFVAQNAENLAADQTPMPDGSGTIASRYRDCVDRLQAPAIRLTEAGMPGAPANAAMPAEVAGNGAPAKTTLSEPATIQAAAPTPAPLTPGRGPAGILPPPFRKMAGS